MDRTLGMGGSDLGPLFGIRPFTTSQTQVDMWLVKTGQTPTEQTPAMRMGHLLEPVILEEYKTITGRIVFGNLLERVDGWRRGHLDGSSWAAGESHSGRVVEAKATGVWRKELGDPGTDQVPPEWLLQGQWYAELADLEAIDYAVMTKPTEVLIYTAERCRDLFKLSDEVAGEFWHKNVKELVPPEPVCLKDCQNLWSKSTATMVTVPADLSPKLDAYQDEYHKLTTIERAVATEKKRLKMVFRALHKGADELWTADKVLRSTCKENKRGVRALNIKTRNHR